VSKTKVDAAGHRAWRPLLVVTAMAICAWATASGMYFSSGRAQASPEPEFREAFMRFAVPANGQWHTVQVEFLMEDTGQGTFEAEAAAARAEMLGRFPGAIEIAPGDASAQYVQNGYWWASRQASWSYNGAGKPAGLSGDQAAVAAAAGTWSSSGINFQFSGGGPTGAGTGACSGGGLDSTNTVGWAAQSGSVLAVTCTWYQQSGNPFPAIEFDMQIDPEWTWTTGGATQVDMESVMLHELGHALGLGHSAAGAASMFASYTAGTLKRSLHADDIAGGTAIYGAAGGPPPTATPTNTPAGPSATPTSTRTPSPTAGGASPTPTQGQGGGGNTPTPSPTPGGQTPTPTATVSATATPTSTATSATATATPAGPGLATPTPRPSLPLRPGANLMTWPGANMAPQQALSQGSGVSAIYSWDPVTYTWKRYFVGLPAYVSNLPQLEQGAAYWFISASAGNVPY
jgi:Matrixin